MRGGVIKGVCRRFLQYHFYEGPLDLRLTGLGSLAVADVGATYEEQVRGGCGFQLANSANAPSAQSLSTTAQWCFYNPQPSATTAYFDVIGMVQQTNLSNSNGATLYVTPVSTNQCGDLRATSQSNTVVKNLNPLASRTSSLVLFRAGPLLSHFQVGEWMPLAFERVLPNTSISGSSLNVMEARGLAGSFIVPPGCGLALFVREPSGNSFAPYATWYEKISDWE